MIENAYKKPFTVTTADGRAFTLGTSARDVLIARMDQIDAVTLICVRRDMPMPTVPLLEKDEPLLSVGTELGWLGYPRVADGLCFFSGRVSMIVDRDHFLVDGTAIHGVSGGSLLHYRRWAEDPLVQSHRIYPTTLTRTRLCRGCR